MSKSAIGILLFLCWVQILFFGWQLYLHKRLENQPVACSETQACMLGAECVGGVEKDAFEWSSIFSPMQNRDQSLNRISGVYERRKLNVIGTCWTWLDGWTGAHEGN